MKTNSRACPSRLTRPLLTIVNEHTLSYISKLPIDPSIVTTKLFNELGTLTPTFESSHFPWIEHRYKSRFNQKYRTLGQEYIYFTRTRRKSSLICKTSDLLKILYLLRTRKISAVRTRLALLEISHRRRCAGRVGTFSMGEFRKLVGSTRITDAQVRAILKSPKIAVTEATLEAMGETLGQRRLDRQVWVPRRLIRHLAAHGSRLEIACALTLAIRRMVGRFGRARVSARMVADLVCAREQHVRTALQSLQAKRLILKNRQAERWSVNKWGSLYDFPDDLSIDPMNEQKPLRAPPKRRSAKGYCQSLHGLVLQRLSRAPMQKGGDLIKEDPSSLLEQQQSLAEALPMAPPNPKMREERQRLGLLAGNLRLDRDKAGAWYRQAWANTHTAADAAEALSLHGFGLYHELLSHYPPHVPVQAPWRRAAA